MVDKSIWKQLINQDVNGTSHAYNTAAFDDYILGKTQTCDYPINSAQTNFFFSPFTKYTVNAWLIFFTHARSWCTYSRVKCARITMDRIQSFSALVSPRLGSRNFSSRWVKVSVLSPTDRPTASISRNFGRESTAKRWKIKGKNTLNNAAAGREIKEETKREKQQSRPAPIGSRDHAAYRIGADCSWWVESQSCLKKQHFYRHKSWRYNLSLRM